MYTSRNYLVFYYIESYLGSYFFEGWWVGKGGKVVFLVKRGVHVLDGNTPTRLRWGHYCHLSLLISNHTVLGGDSHPSHLILTSLSLRSYTPSHTFTSHTPAGSGPNLKAGDVLHANSTLIRPSKVVQVLSTFAGA